LPPGFYPSSLGNRIRFAKHCPNYGASKSFCKGCHLCEIVKESLVKLHKRGGFDWRGDVDSNAELRRQYNDQVPVVFINGRKVFKYRMDEQEFLRKLAS
jgi:hypothetical protein